MRGFVALVVIGAGILVLIAVVRLAQSSSKALAQDRAMSSAFVANPANGIILSVRGWNHGELSRILSDFRGLYDLPTRSDWTVADDLHGDLSIAFPGDIEPKLLLFLVNYIAYPKNFDLTHRAIGILCRVTLTSAFGVPDASLVGKKAMIYVPANDTEYDLVYAKVESGEAYRIPFTTLIWEPVSDARMPISAKDL
jgi:hypothetical protein